MRVVVYGSRPDGHARVVIELLLAGAGHELVGLLDDYPENAEREVAGARVFGGRDAMPALLSDGVEGVVLGFGSAEGRREIVRAAEAAGLRLPTLVHLTAHVAASAELAAGAQVLPQASVGPGARVGSGSLVNTAAVIEHDVNVADGAVVGPGAIAAGRAAISAEASIGAGAVVLPDVVVGERSTVGAGAVVHRDVPAGTTVTGVPARTVS